MALRKRIYDGFDGCQKPAVPRAPRSVRRGSCKKPVQDDHVCAFELLAKVAGQLLMGTESSDSSNASQTKDFLGIHLYETKLGQVKENMKASKSDCLDQDSCMESVFIPELAAKEFHFQPTWEDVPAAENDCFDVGTSKLASSDSLENVDCDLKLAMCSAQTFVGNLPNTSGSSYPLEGVCNGRMENAAKQFKDEIAESKYLTVAKTCSVKRPADKCLKSELVTNSDSNVQLSLYRDLLPSASFPKHRNNVKLGIKDDGDNSFRFNKFSSKFKVSKPWHHNSERRNRKTLTSKYWKMATRLNGYDLSNTDEGLVPFHPSRKMVCLRDRCHFEVPSKRRKLRGRSFAYDKEASSESNSYFPENRIKREDCRSDSILLLGNKVSAFAKVHRRPKDSKVKFSIKSFKVPELYIEVPETATVGLLKRTVMETVTTILGGALRVGVVLQGKKIRDDDRTLQQVGISQNDNLDTLGFVLEPSFTPAASPGESPHSFECDLEQKALRFPASPNLESGLSNATFGPPLETTKVVNQDDSNKEIMTSCSAPADSLTNEALPDSKVLVSFVPDLNAEALAVLPLNQKTIRCETSQRRSRRPFSVTEVDALIEAVEILGTGRWRDVKMRAFDIADYRTYVDLKDKWKTLVHTASISPQQRRGEPVPQELLDRVLLAHAYWSQRHLSKQHGKHEAQPLKFMRISL